MLYVLEAPTSCISPLTGCSETFDHFKHPFQVNVGTVHQISSQQHETWGSHSDVVENASILGWYIVSLGKKGTIYPTHTLYKPQTITNCFNIVSISLFIKLLAPEVDPSRHQPEVKFSNPFHCIYMASCISKLEVALHYYQFISSVEFLLLFWL